MPARTYRFWLLACLAPLLFMELVLPLVALTHQDLSFLRGVNPVLVGVIYYALRFIIWGAFVVTLAVIFWKRAPRARTHWVVVIVAVVCLVADWMRLIDFFEALVNVWLGRPIFPSHIIPPLLTVFPIGVGIYMLFDRAPASANAS